jgi:tRNA nucleotidyltransferase (CCA-adding enzyme)
MGFSPGRSWVDVFAMVRPDQELSQRRRDVVEEVKLVLSDVVPRDRISLVGSVAEGTDLRTYVRTRGFGHRP